MLDHYSHPLSARILIAEGAKKKKNTQKTVDMQAPDGFDEVFEQHLCLIEI